MYWIQGVTKRCRLSWLTNSDLVHQMLGGGGGGCGVSANEYRGGTTWTGDFKCRELKLDFAEIDHCKPVLLGRSLARNLVKPLMSLYGTEWRERGYGLGSAHGAQINFGDLTPYLTYDCDCIVYIVHCTYRGTFASSSRLTSCGILRKGNFRRWCSRSPFSQISCTQKFKLKDLWARIFKLFRTSDVMNRFLITFSL
jgi:hypothetical protein